MSTVPYTVLHRDHRDCPLRRHAVRESKRVAVMLVVFLAVLWLDYRVNNAWTGAALLAIAAAFFYYVGWWQTFRPAARARNRRLRAECPHLNPTAR